MKELLTVKNLNKHFDGIKALDNFSCTVNQNEIVGLIGPNGAGKSTLFNVITGFIQSDSGSAHFKERNVIGKSPHKISTLGVSRIFQNLRLIRQMTVLENVLLCFKNQPGEELGNIFFKQKHFGKIENENKTRAMSLLKDAGIAEKANDLANNMSYGQQKLLSIVCCLAAGADLLLLDEPVAGIAPEMIEKILKIITGFLEQGKAAIIIEHNMDVISQVCNRVIFMDAGKKVCEGTPEEVRNDPKVIEAYLD